MMRAYLYWTFATILRLRVALASNFDTALDLVVRYHGKDTKGLSKTVDTLTQIATRLRDEPDDPKFRSIRLLNKTFWERIGSVNGGIPFMTAMGFDLVDQGTGDGPSFRIRPDAGGYGEVQKALESLSKVTGAKEPAQDDDHEYGRGNEAEAPSPSKDGTGFNPFATAFSRKSRTRLQERAEKGLVNMEERQSRRQQRFSKLEERNVTILLPQTNSRKGPPDASHSDPPKVDEEGDAEQRELELVAQLWRERMMRDDVERFETSAAKKYRLLRTSKIYPYVLLRVRLPGGVYLQARFNADESLQTVYEVVEASLAAEMNAGKSIRSLQHRFELFVAPPTRVLPRDDTRLRYANIVTPACVLHLRWESEAVEVERWAQQLEGNMMRSTGDLAHPRLPYSSRFDVPEALSPRRAQASKPRGADGVGSRRHTEDAGVGSYTRTVQAAQRARPT